MLIPFYFCTNSNSNSSVNNYTLPSLPPQIIKKSKYSWTEEYNLSSAVINQIACPEGYERVIADSSSFSFWLQHLPLKEKGLQVKLYNGELKYNQNAHYRIINIDVGTKDLQQCADAVMRLRAEYLYSYKRFNDIKFHYTNGFLNEFTKWTEGYRPKINGNKVNWVKTEKPSTAYSTFKNYLWNVFSYCGSKSLSGELEKVKNTSDMKAGDVFILGGSPGHVVIIIDVAINKKTNKKAFMIAQSYMPAQEMHILKNPNDSKLSPWYDENFGDILKTPEWEFSKDQMMKFKN